MTDSELRQALQDDLLRRIPDFSKVDQEISKKEGKFTGRKLLFYRFDHHNCSLYCHLLSKYNITSFLLIS